MAYDPIRRAYCVHPNIGQRITVYGRPGTIMQPNGDYPYRLNVKFDDSPFETLVHPDWGVNYNPKEGAP